MTWLYVPSTHCPSAPALEDWSSDSSLLTSVAERTSEASVMWRGKPALPQVWSRRWRRGGFIPLLSGLILEPSTVASSAASWISSLRETRASQIASQDAKTGRTTIDFSSIRLSESSMKAGRIVSSARTSSGTPTGNFPPSSQHWKNWAAGLRQEYSRRPKPEIPCSASDCSSWPTARAEDAESAGKRISRDVSDTLTAKARDWQAPRAAQGAYQRDKGDPNKERPTLDGMARDESNWKAPVADDTISRGKKYAQGGTALSTQAEQQWKAPQAADGKRGEDLGRQTRGAGGDSLVDQTKQWPGPAARDHRNVNSADHVETNGSGAKHMDQLPNFAVHAFDPEKKALKAWPGPMASDDGQKVTSTSHQTMLRNVAPDVTGSLPLLSQVLTTPEDGPNSSTDSPNTNQHSPKSRLNPIFVGALMRWPTGLSRFERQETAWIQWWQVMPTFFSTLFSERTGPKQEELF